MLDVLGPAMFASLVFGLLAGFPVAFSLAGVAGVFGLIGLATGHFNPEYLLAMLFRIQGTFNNDNLLAIPMLVLMGMLLERTGIAEDMFLALNRAFGKTRGGLAYSTIFVGAILSAITGFVSASVVAIGLISLPPMIRAGYDPRLSTGVVAATGTLAQILPPSLVLIVLAEQLDVSLLDIYRGSLMPALILLMSYIAYVFAVTTAFPNLAPIVSDIRSIPKDGDFTKSFMAAAVPLALVFGVLASIFFGVATPSEGGAIGVTGALVLGAIKWRLTVRTLREATGAAGNLCSCIVFLLLGASFFSLVFRGFDGHIWIESLFAHLPSGAHSFVVFVNLAVFILAFFLDFFEIAFIVLPLVAPIARKLDIDMVWLTVLLAVNLQTSFLHPPFGIALYNLRSVAAQKIKTTQIYAGAIPFIVLQLAVIGLLFAFPGIVLRPAAVTLDGRFIEIDIPVPDEVPEDPAYEEIDQLPKEPS